MARYVEASILERDDRIAACTLYRHRNVAAAEVDQGLVEQFEAQARRRWSRAHDLDLRLIERDLDRLVPPDIDPAWFTCTGALLLRPWRETPRDAWGQPVNDNSPSALSYVRERAYTH